MKNQPKPPITLNVYPATLLWVCVLLFLIPLLLTGLLSH